jgi:hypothetical protein
MKTKTVTVGDVMRWKPCWKYTRDYVKLLFDKRKRLTVADILSLNIRLVDRIWAASHMLTKRQMTAVFKLCGFDRFSSTDPRDLYFAAYDAPRLTLAKNAVISVLKLRPAKKVGR